MKKEKQKNPKKAKLSFEEIQIVECIKGLKSDKLCNSWMTIYDHFDFKVSDLCTGEFTDYPDGFKNVHLSDSKEDIEIANEFLDSAYLMIAKEPDDNIIHQGLIMLCDAIRYSLYDKDSDMVFRDKVLSFRPRLDNIIVRTLPCFTMLRMTKSLMALLEMRDNVSQFKIL